MLVACGLLLGLLPASETAAQTRRARDRESSQTSGKPADYRSKNFILHTDISAEEAQELLKKLETMLSLISKYWGRPPSGIIEMYVIRDLRNWSDVPLDPDGVESIRKGAGLTKSLTISNGNRFVAKSVVYAVDNHGTPQHEAVHAYCAQTFGRLGPTWYAEGMAEMGQYWVENDPSVNCHQVVVDYLRASEPKPLSEIMDRNAVTGDSWQNYAWRWALCHLLANNKNYAQRFRPLGMGLLLNQGTSFEGVYGPMDREIEFEYRFFLKHLGRGYRVDLCSWDWKARFQAPRAGSATTARIEARGGWQPSRLRVKQGEEYEFSASGTWQTKADDKAVSADGDASGKGRLVGILFNDYELSKPFELGAYGSFVAPGDGDLFLRCRDSWSELADNDGRMSVRLKVKGKGLPLAPPKGLEAAGDTPDN